MEVLTALARAATLIFAVSSMLSVGFSYALKDIIGPLRDVRAVLRALVANFLLVPLLAYLVVLSLGLDEPLSVGILLVATAAGTPFLIQLTTAAGGDVGLSATLLVLLLPATVIYMPLTIPLLVPGASVSAGAIALPLVLGMLLPLAFGLLVRARAPRWAQRLRPILSKTSRYALVTLIAATLLVRLPEILDMTLRAVLAALLVTSGAFGVGYLLGGKDPDKRDVLGLGTGQRNIAAATVVASQGFSDPKTLVMVVITSLVGLSILFPIAAQLREREAERTQARAPYEKGLVATRTGRPSSTQRGLERPSAPNSSPISG